MSFNGPALSIDDEGSILFDGEKFIVTVPADDELLEHFNPGERPVIYTHSSQADSQQAATEQTTEPGSDSESGGQGRASSSKKVIRPPAAVHRQPIFVPPDILDINQDAVGSFEEQIASLSSGQPETTWHDTTPLTHLQAEQVDYLLTEETDSLAREVLIALKRDGIPPRREWNNFMAQYALFSWDSESDAQAWVTLATIANSDWDETTAYADENHVEAVAQDRANDWIEGITIIHAGDRPHLARPDRCGESRWLAVCGLAGLLRWRL